MPRGENLCRDCFGEANSHWKGDDITYTGAHERVKAQRGRASEHSCVGCEQTATNWSYDHTDPNEKFQFRKNGMRAYSTDPAHYSPRCRSCHTIFDNEACAA